MKEDVIPDVKFGDVIEWPGTSGVVRWLVLAIDPQHPGSATAMWLVPGHHYWRVGSVENVGIRGTRIKVVAR